MLKILLQINPIFNQSCQPQSSEFSGQPCITAVIGFVARQPICIANIIKMAKSDLDLRYNVRNFLALVDIQRRVAAFKV